MKLYPKKLNSIEALERERRKLKRAIAETNPTDVFGAGKTDKKSRKQAATDTEETIGGNENLLVTITDLLTSKGVADVVLSLISPLMGVLGRKAGKGILKPLAKEVLGGYVKWKLIEISYKTAVRFIRSKQHQHKSKKD